MIETKCQNCLKIFLARKQDLKRGHAKFCGRKCFGENRTKTYKPSQFRKPNTKCAYCAKEYFRSEASSRKTRSGLHFCCRDHKEIYQMLMGKDFSGNNKTYRTKVFKLNENKCFICGYNKIIEILEVHHIDCNRKNNSLENLRILCPTCHEEEHFLNKTGKWG